MEQATQFKFDKKRFKDYREKQLKMTQEQAAAGIGVLRQTLASWEKEGGHCPSISQLSKIGQVYGIAGTFFLVQE